jgi:hypothetical protein
MVGGIDLRQSSNTWPSVSPEFAFEDVGGPPKKVISNKTPGLYLPAPIAPRSASVSEHRLSRLCILEDLIVVTLADSSAFGLFGRITLALLGACVWYTLSAAITQQMQHAPKLQLGR